MQITPDPGETAGGPFPEVEPGIDVPCTETEAPVAGVAAVIFAYCRYDGGIEETDVFGNDAGYFHYVFSQKRVSHLRLSLFHNCLMYIFIKILETVLEFVKIQIFFKHILL
jgi:hypothetical protein